MKRKFLEELGLEADVIDQIMNENGKDVNKAKGDYEDIKEQLEAAQGTITDLKKSNKDNETLQTKVTEYETKIAELEKTAAEKDFNYHLEDALKGSKAKNMTALKALLDLGKVKLKDGKLDGLEDQLKALQDTDSYLFETAEPQAPSFGGAKPANTGGAPAAVTREQFGKMSYKERVELYNSQPEIYQQLSE